MKSVNESEKEREREREMQELRKCWRTDKGVFDITKCLDRLNITRILIA